MKDIDQLHHLASILKIPPERLGLAPVGEHDQSTVRRPQIPHQRITPELRRTPAQLPPDFARFAARQRELERLDAQIGSVRKPPPTAVVFVVFGEAGVGKSVLARHWAHRVADRFPDGQLYVDLRGFDPSGRPPLHPADALHAFLEGLGANPGNLPVEFDARVGRYRDLLHRKRMLVVLDNAHDSNQVEHLLPGSRGCVVIVTSRSTLSDLVARHGARPLHLDVLEPDDARRVLDRWVGKDRIAAEPDAAAAIVEACAGLPIMLGMTGAQAASRPHIPLASLAAELRDSRGRLDALTRDGGETDPRAVFRCSYSRLSHDAARMFRYLSLHPGPDVTIPVAASLTGLSREQSANLLAELIRLHLVNRPTMGRYGMHDLLREYASDLSERLDGANGRRVATERMVDHYRHSAVAAERNLSPDRDPVMLVDPRPGVVPEEPDSDQAMTWFSAEHQALLAVIELARELGRSTAIYHVAWALHTYFDRQGHWNDSITTLRAALDATRRTGDRRMQAHAHRLIARSFTQLKQFKSAHTHCVNAIELCDPCDRVALANAHAAHALVFEEQGKLPEALRRSEQALTLFRAAGHLVGEARTLNDVAWICTKLGECERALSTGLRALKLHGTLGNPEGEANAWDSLGTAHLRLADHRRSIGCFRKACALFRMLENRREEARSLNGLGLALRAVDDHRAAREAWQRALGILDEIDHSSAGEVRENLADLPQPTGMERDVG